jgi:Ca-activated chloride channel family protein
MMNTPSPHATHLSPEPSLSGSRLVSTTGRALPLLGTTLTADAAGGVARITVEQRFRNPHAEPLAVTYSLPLPSDGAVSGFSFVVAGRRVAGEIDRRSAARARYEDALLEGRSAALLEQDRSSLFTQEIGNIPPGEEVIVEVSIDQRLRWLDEGAWEWRFPTVVAPRYLGEPGRVADADRVAQDVASGPLEARFALSCSIRDALAGEQRPESPSHSIQTVGVGGASRVTLRDAAGARLDRDVVVRWRVATPKVGLALDAGRAASRPPSQLAHGLLTVVPPSAEAGTLAVPRDLVVLLDTSGSMAGEPLAQAVRVTSALVETLREQDQLELIEFSNAPRRWKHMPVPATEPMRREAVAWLRALRASGSTEMREGIVEALSGVRAEAQRQVVLITDGQIGFESTVVAAVCERLPAASRLHTVGVGSAVNRSLTGPAARAGHGIEVIVGLGEDPERAATRLVARTRAPLLVDLVLGGSALLEHAPAKLPDLFAGAPALVGVALRPDGGELTVRGRTLEGTWEQRLRVAPIAPGQGNQAVVALFGREAVEDLETRLAAGVDAREIDARIERLGVDYQISTRLTSWVAVSEERTIDPSEPLRRMRMPHELPYGMSAEGLGLRPAMPAAALARAMPAKALNQSLTMGAEALKLSNPLSFSHIEPPKSAAEAHPFSESSIDDLDALYAEDEAAPAGPAPAEEVWEWPRVWLRGRVVIHREDLLVVEVLADGGPLAWSPDGRVRVVFVSRGVVAEIDERRTTRKGTVETGATARLALKLPPGTPIAQVVLIAVDLGGEIVTIEV